MSTTIICTPNAINPNVNLEWLREQMLDALQTAQGDADKCTEPDGASYYQGCADTAKHFLNMITMPDLRLVCEYQLVGDVENAHDWMVDNFTRAIEGGIILKGAIKGVYPGSWGLRLINFTVDIPYNEMLFEKGLSADDQKERAEGLLDGLVHDTDLRVRWVSYTR